MTTVFEIILQQTDIVVNQKSEMENVTRAELRKRISELSPEGQRDVYLFIEFLIWKKQNELLKKVSDGQLLDEVKRRNLTA